MLDVAGEVCGHTKGKPRLSEVWWWNGVVVAVNRKRKLCNIWKRSSNEGNRRYYSQTEKVIKRVVAAATSQTSREAIEKVEINFDDCELLQIAKQRAK